MEYDPVKDRLQKFLGTGISGRKLFFAALDRLFLRARYVRRELVRLKSSGFLPADILDGGSGFGQYSFRMAQIFPSARIIGLDLKKELVESGNQFVRKAGYDQVSFTVGDLLSMTYENQFDLVLSVDVMEHIEDDLTVFDNISRSLKSGGLFVMTTPYFDGSSQRMPVADQPFVDEHVRPGYSRSELADKLNQANMELREFIITYGKWGNLAWLLLQKWPMSWLSGRSWLLPLVALYFCLVYPLAWIFMQLDLQTDNTDGGGILAMAAKR